MKAIVIQGCKDCPYKKYHTISSKWWCEKDIEPRNHFLVSKNYYDIPSTSHPDCKLNDLPSDIWKIIDESTEGVSFQNEQSMADTKTGAMMGANFVIERIKK